MSDDPAAQPPANASPARPSAEPIAAIFALFNPSPLFNPSLTRICAAFVRDPSPPFNPSLTRIALTRIARIAT